MQISRSIVISEKNITNHRKKAEKGLFSSYSQAIFWHNNANAYANKVYNLCMLVFSKKKKKKKKKNGNVYSGGFDFIKMIM